MVLACNQKTFDTEKELLDYITNETNGYLQKKTVNGYDFALMYRPTDLLVKQELSDSITDKEVEKLRAKYNKYMYFNLSMSRNNQELLSTAPKNRQEFGAMVNQLAFGMGEKVHLYTKSKDTLKLVDYVYPRMYGMSKATTIMFVYPRDKEMLESDYFIFTIEDLGFVTGEIKFKIKTETVQEQPLLNFKDEVILTFFEKK